jgi:hypothetical protein
MGSNEHTTRGPVTTGLRTIGVNPGTHVRLTEMRDQLSATWEEQMGARAKTATFDDAITVLLDTWAEIQP